MTQLSRREKWLAGAVGAAAFIFVNIFVIDYLLTKQGQLRGDRAKNAGALIATQRLLAERATWQEREAWLSAHQPRSGADAGAGVQLLNSIKEVASAHSVEIEDPSLPGPMNKPEYTSVSINFSAKGNWRGLLGFLGELQRPDNFVVFESANLKVNAADATQMHGTFRLAKWFAPVKRSQ